jgi:hypothetical protein
MGVKNISKRDRRNRNRQQKDARKRMRSVMKKPGINGDHDLFSFRDHE